MNILSDEFAAAQRNAAAEAATKAREEWARDWFAGNAMCPGCGRSDNIQSVDQDSDGSSVIDLWSCGDCETRWKVELREAALSVINEDDTDSDWIEREDVEEKP